MIPLQLYDITQYEFEEICEKHKFYFFEKQRGSGGDLEEYCNIWKEIDKIDLSPNIKYKYKTSLGNIVELQNDNDREWPEDSWTIKSE